MLENTVTENERFALARAIGGSGKAFYDLVLAQGLEGVVAKKKESLYYPGKRTKDWVKVKNVEEDDYVICGYMPAEHVAMLILGQYNARGALVYKGRATLGLATKDFARIRRVPQAAGWPFAERPVEIERDAIWLAPELVCTVEFLRRMEGGLMRQPHYKGLRLDKAPQEAIEP